MYRALTCIGMRWVKPQFDDPRAGRTQITFERCEIRRHLSNGLIDSETVLSTEETTLNNFTDQQTRALGTPYKKPTSTKNKMGGLQCTLAVLYNRIQNER